MAVDEWDYREVCPDGGCVGVIGADGTCKVCGRVSPTWDNERERGMVVDGADPGLDPVGDEGDDDDDDDGADDGADGDDGDDDDDDDNGDNGDDDGDAPALVPGQDPAWSRRALCPDGACVGVIGAGGTCSVCGKSAA
ncbi:MAG: hypothetical protein ABI467_21470 [Kofleriaceae bacterium]